MARSIRRVVFAMLFIVVALPVSGTAQELEDGDNVRSTKLGLVVPPLVRREKRRSAKRGDWAWTMAAASGAGYASNVHLSATQRQDSAVFEGAVRGEVLHYFTRDSRLRIRAEVDAAPHSETSDPDDYRQSVSVFYGHELVEDLKLLFSTEAEHINDSVTTVEGATLDRDFESWNYRMKPTVSYSLARDHRVRLQYPAKRKDYKETSGMNSLDWWTHGPRLAYDWSLNDDIDFELSYGFKVQNYDKEPASLADGTEAASNPDEEHFFHQIHADASWVAIEGLELKAGAGWKRKDDRFRDYESYDAFLVGLGGSVDFMGVLMSAEVDYQRRDYAERPDDDTGTLEFDRIDFSLAARRQISDSIGVFAGYGLRWRDTNRSQGTSYRDHTAHSVLAGLSWAL